MRIITENASHAVALAEKYIYNRVQPTEIMTTTTALAKDFGLQLLTLDALTHGDFHMEETTETYFAIYTVQNNIPYYIGFNYYTSIAEFELYTAEASKAIFTLIDGQYLAYVNKLTYQSHLLYATSHGSITIESNPDASRLLFEQIILL